MHHVVIMLVSYCDKCLIAMISIVIWESGVSNIPGTSCPIIVHLAFLYIVIVDIYIVYIKRLHIILQYLFR